MQLLFESLGGRPGRQHLPTAFPPSEDDQDDHADDDHADDDDLDDDDMVLRPSINIPHKGYCPPI